MVTGASGLLGVNLAHEAAKEHQVVGVVNERVFQADGFEVKQADLLASNAIASLLDETQPDGVIHCAAIAHVDVSEKDPDLAYLTNTELPGEIARQVAKRDISLIHISTDAVFDGTKGDYTEDDEPNPLSVYAKTKLIGEQAVADAYPEAIVARVNLFGWSLTGKRSLAEFFYYNLSEGKPLKGFTDVYFCPMLVNHIAGVLLDMLKHKLSGLYHVVSPDCMTKYDFGVAIAEKFSLDAGLIAPVSVSEGGLAAARSPKLTLNSEKLTAALGYTPPDVHAGLSRLYELHQSGYPKMLRDSVLEK